MKRKRILCTILLLMLLGGCGNSEEQDQQNQEIEYVEVPKAKQERTESEENQFAEENDNDMVSQETNYLKQLDIVPIPVVKNAGTDKANYYAFVRADIELTKGISEQEYIEFCNECIKDSGYRYFTIDFQNGMGIVFPNCSPETGMYGEIDVTRSITKASKYIGISEDGTVVLTDSNIE